MATSDVEKDNVSVDHLEQLVTKIPDSEEDALNEARIQRFSPAEQAKIIRRVDRRLVVTLGFMYCGRFGSQPVTRSELTCPKSA